MNQLIVWYFHLLRCGFDCYRVRQHVYLQSVVIKTGHADVDAVLIFGFCELRWGEAQHFWLRAEREVLCFPPSELAETKDEYRINVGVPGFDDYALQVDVLPHSITVEATTEKMEVPNDELIHFSEFGGKKLLRQFD